MSFFCPHCDTENAAPHAWQGMRVQCPSCLHDITLAYRMGQSIAPTGYQVTFTDFCRLIDDKANISLAHPEIAKLLSCAVVSLRGRYVLRQANGALIPREVAHSLIQADPVKQQSLYNTAMTLWR
jgi:hypothetical protein